MVERWPAACGSIGYQGRSIEEICEALSDRGVDLLLDVRERAWSQRPEFRKSALRRALENGGIGYAHLKSAGNPFRPRKGERRDREVCATRFREHLSENPDVLRVVAETARERRVALFCYEAETSDCHRGVLLEALAEEFEGLVCVDL